jgi:hypothetical protein
VFVFCVCVRVSACVCVCVVLLRVTQGCEKVGQKSSKMDDFAFFRIRTGD